MESEWIIRRLRERGLSIADFGREINRTRAVASKIINGDVRLQLDQIEPLARLLGVSFVDVLRLAGISLPGMSPQLVPVLSSVEAGSLTAACEPDYSDTQRPSVLVDHESKRLAALEVHGDSMDRIAPSGSVIVFDYSAIDLNDKDLAVFRRDGETTFKRFRRDGNGIWLEPDSFNTRHASIVLGNEERLEVIGRVVAITRLTSAD